MLSVREVLRQRRAHCIEGAFVAACALWIHGKPPLVMHMDCDAGDCPHVVALFRSRSAWGAISKSNGAALRYRDPVYRSLRELALSYFHEYCDRRGRRTLRSYTAAFDLRRVEPAPLGHARRRVQRRRRPVGGAAALFAGVAAAGGRLSRRDPFERRAAALVEYPPPSSAGRLIDAGYRTRQL